ncbi:site-specific integrase [Sporosarcina sp. P18a]|uniref:tyrosine-type recombinase/integrase n=1 Tax=Sporosarcina sp. P18a TaxID=2048259 RepID=UPI000C16754C|nr:tyrosine-type recombinase/integrase [Sporosarcina sp. P18a]PIC80705.1 site-specific integrase [Sporosarcina sp. P18a]
MSKQTPIKPYKLKNGDTRYMFRISLGTDPLTGKQKNTTRRSFRTRKQAQLAYDRIKFELRNGTFRKQTAETYNDIYLIWIKSYEKTVQDSTFLKTSRLFKNHILPAMGHYKIDKIDVAICQKHVEQWAEVLKGFKMVKSYAAKVITFAMIRGYININVNPFELVEIPIDKKRISFDEEPVENFYTREQLIEFLDSLKQEEDLRLYVFFNLLVCSGMRKSEALALMWKDINFATSEIRINKAIARGIEGLYLGPTKNGLPRTIELDKKTIRLLKKWKKEQAVTYLKLGFNTRKQNQYVFPNTKNELQDPNKTCPWLKNILDKYNLDHITTHGLRHTHCSLLFEAGATIKEVQVRLGHKDVKTTLDVYAHVTKKAKAGTIKKFDNYLAN